MSDDPQTNGELAKPHECIGDGVRDIAAAQRYDLTSLTALAEPQRLKLARCASSQPVRDLAESVRR